MLIASSTFSFAIFFDLSIPYMLTKVFFFCMLSFPVVLPISLLLDVISKISSVIWKTNPIMEKRLELFVTWANDMKFERLEEHGHPTPNEYREEMLEYFDLVKIERTTGNVLLLHLDEKPIKPTGIITPKNQTTS